MTTNNTKPIYFENIDIIRTFAFLLVFWYHGCIHLFGFLDLESHLFLKSIISTGGEGVRIFFVLSGFLITYLLYKEYSDTGKINVFHFYMRRVLRIWPLYYLVVLISICINPISQVLCLEASWTKALLFLINFECIQPDTVACLPNHYKVLWSVCIEEQYYLFWPLLSLLIFRNKTYFVIVLSVIIIFGFSYKFSTPMWHGYFHTFGNIQYLMIGCMASYLIFRNNSEKTKQFFNDNKNKLTWIILHIIGVIAFVYRYQKGISGFVSNCILPFYYLFIVLQFTFTISTSFKYFSVFKRLGKYTYGLYVYHFLLIIFFKIIFDKLGLSYKDSILYGILLSALSLIASIFVSYTSYHMFEKKYLH